MHAKVFSINPVKGYAFLEDLENGVTYFCHGKNYVEDSVGKRNLIPGEIVAFDLVKNPKGPEAINLRPVSNPRPPAPPNYREIGTVAAIHETGQLCFLERADSLTSLILHRRNIRPEFRRRFALGQKWELTPIAPPKPGMRWEGIDAVAILENGGAQ